ncbi:MAG: surface/cell-adhesion protein, partial [Clostridia bacterium]|nr:surface/cell-adhesion protein [Clostridia bacterium]
MRSNLIKAAAVLLAAYMIVVGALSVCAGNAYAAGDSFLGGISAYKLSASASSSTQGWIDGDLTETAGVSAEWYVFALRQSGSYDFSRYVAALRAYDAEHHVASAVTRQKHALALYAAGASDAAVADMAAGTVGGQGIMSYVFGIHLLRNGISCGASLSQAKSVLLSLQLADGGFAVMGQQGDVDVTAMTLQALAPDYRADAAVTAAADKAVAFLSGKQKAGGQFGTYGVDNAESTAQVLLAMVALGIDPSDPRFVKDGHTVIDGLAQYRLSSGAFSHTAGGGYNELATAQVFDALTAYCRMGLGSSFYRFPHAPTAAPTVKTAAPTKPAHKTTAAHTP